MPRDFVFLCTCLNVFRFVGSLKNSTHRTGQRYGKRWATLPHEMTNANGSVLGVFCQEILCFVLVKRNGSNCFIFR